MVQYLAAVWAATVLMEVRAVAEAFTEAEGLVAAVAVVDPATRR